MKRLAQSTHHACEGTCAHSGSHTKANEQHAGKAENNLESGNGDEKNACRVNRSG